MRTRELKVVGCAAFALLQLGCASWFMNGASQHAGLPRDPIARFTIQSCQMPDGTQIPGPANQWYYLAQSSSGPVVYELDASAEGAAITNHWTDERGDLFFVWVANSHGWVFAFPRDRSRLPQRFVYAAGTYQLSRVGSATVPVGSPAAVCNLVPG